MTTLLCLKHEPRQPTDHLAPGSFVGSPKDWAKESARPRPPPIRALCLSNRPDGTLGSLPVEGTLYGTVPTPARCDHATASGYSVCSDRQGNPMIVSDGIITPLNDFGAALKDVVQNKAHIRLVPNPYIPGKPLFFSDSQISPFVFDAVVQPLFSSYFEIPDVRAYINKYVHSESRIPDLAISPLSTDFTRVAKELVPDVGEWFLVNGPLAQPDEVIAVMLTERKGADQFVGRFYSPVPVDLRPGSILHRELAPHGPSPRLSCDCFKILEIDHKSSA